MTTEVGTIGATTLSRMNFSGYVGHATAWCSVLRLGLGLGLGLDFVSGRLEVMHTYLLLSIVIVTLPTLGPYLRSSGVAQ